MPKELEDLDLDALALVTGGAGGARPMRDSALAGVHSSTLGSEVSRPGSLAGFGHASHVASDLRPSFGHDEMLAGLAAQDAPAHELGIAVCGVVSPQHASVADAAAYTMTTSNLR